MFYSIYTDQIFDIPVCECCDRVQVYDLDSSHDNLGEYTNQGPWPCTGDRDIYKLTTDNATYYIYYQTEKYNYLLGVTLCGGAYSGDVIGENMDEGTGPTGRYTTFNQQRSSWENGGLNARCMGECNYLNSRFIRTT